MNETRETLALLGACLPLFSALIWMTMTALSVYDSRTELECRIKKTILWYYIFMVLVWLSLLFYTYIPAPTAYLTVPACLAYLLTPVQFYRYICALSETRKKLKPFFLWHYALPVLIVFVLGVYSLFVPRDYFFSILLMGLVSVTVYTVLSFVRLQRYYRVTAERTNKHFKPAHWIVRVMGLTAMLLLFTIIALELPGGEIITSWPMLSIALILVVQNFIMGYNMIRRNFLLYIPSVKKSMSETDTGLKKQKHKRSPQQLQNEVNALQDSQSDTGLTQKKFEHYISSHKSWLNPGLKITDLVLPLETNRTSLSNFINKVYKVNFNRYINRLRLAELEWLLSLPSNAGKTADELFHKAGFASRRNYIRAKMAEQNDNSNKDSNHTTDKEDAK